jgi:hypothetical protein
MPYVIPLLTATEPNMGTTRRAFGAFYALRVNSDGEAAPSSPNAKKL